MFTPPALWKKSIMSKSKNTLNLLTQAILASSFFMTPYAFANTYGGGVTTPGPVSVAGTTNHIVEILGGPATIAGQIATVGGNAINLDVMNGQVLIDANNGFVGIDAVSVTGGVIGQGIFITQPNTIVAVGAGSGIHNADTIAGSSGILVSSTGAAIANYGTIVTDAVGVASSAIEISAASGAAIVNQVGGYISSGATGGAAGIGATILTDAAGVGTAISNAGRINALGTNDAIAINASTAITNTGIIFAVAPLHATIATTTASQVVAVVNSGEISNGAGAAAINFAANSSNASILQAGGLIAGNVLLASLDATGNHNTFVMTGGIIDGNVIENATHPQTFAMSGGTINGIVELGSGGTNTVNLSGGTIAQIQGGASTDIINVTGGYIIELGPGFGGVDVLNVNASFTGNIITGIPTINVVNAGTLFTVGGPITALTTAANINAGAGMLVNAPITGTGNIVNNGLIVLNSTWDNASGVTTNTSGSVFQVGAIGQLITTTFTDNAGSFYEPVLYAYNNYGQVIVTGTQVAANLMSGSFLAPQLVSGQFYQAHSRFDVIAAITPTGAIVDNSTLVQPPSVILSLSKGLLGDPAAGLNTLVVTVSRNSYSSQSSSQQTMGVALTLDGLAAGTGPTNVDFLTLLGNVDFDATQSQLQNDMASLTPPANYGLVEGSHIGMDDVFNVLTTRIRDMRQGLNYGDYSNKWGVWGDVFGAHLNQEDLESVNGYHANAAGLVVGGDWEFTECTLIGLAASYTKANVSGKGEAPKDQGIKSWQATIYGWYEPTEKIFIDAMLGIADQRFHTNRVITANVVSSAANASFNGTLYGVMGDIGYAIVNNATYYAAPLFRIKYNSLDLGSYTESGAGGLSLTVDGQNLNEFSCGLGFRLASTYVKQKITWVPELSAILSYDFVIDNEQTTSSFLGGGIAFDTNGAIPGKTIFDLGLGLNAYLNSYSIVTIQYNLELRDEYMSNSGFLKYYYYWG